MYGDIKSHLQQEIESIKDAGLFKEERIITSPQGAELFRIIISSRCCASC